MESIRRAALAVALATMMAPLASHAATALDPNRGTGNQAWGFALGMDFDVGAAGINVQQLGAFDSEQDGLKSAIEVGIFNRNTQSLVGSSVLIPISGGTAVGQNVFVDVPDFTLPAGNYSIVAFGYSSLELNGNADFGGPISTIDTGGGLISFVNTARYNTSGGFSYPTGVDGGPANRYDAGTFIFAPVPEPQEWAMMLAGIGLVGLMAKRGRRRSMAQAA